MKECELFHSLFEYFPETGDLKWKQNKGRAKAGEQVGWITVKGYREAKINQICYKVHRIIFMMMNDRWPEGELDHKNGSKADNKWSNLRECTHEQNMHNQLQHSHNTSGITGVSWHKRIKKWQSFIIHKNEQIHLGYFDNQNEAMQARKSAELKLWNGFKQVDEIVSSA